MVWSLVISSAFLLFLNSVAVAEERCEKDSLPCDDGECVRREEWCDGKEACEDGSDEAYCEESRWWGSPNKCGKEIHFRCKDGLCWPIGALCDGITDCRDASDEQNCDSNTKLPDKSDTKSEESGEVKESSEEIKEKDNGGELKEISGENEESKESSEENENNEVKTTETTSLTTTTDENDDYEEYEDSTTEVPFQTTTVRDTAPPFPTFDAVLSTKLQSEVRTEFPLWPQTTEKDFYARKMEQIETKRQYYTQTNGFSTTTNRPPPLRTTVPYPTRPSKSQHPIIKKNPVPYTGPTRAYIPRLYRYIGNQNIGQMPIPYRGQRPYHSPDTNYISSQSRNNHRQPYLNLNDNSGRADWRIGVHRPPRFYGSQMRLPSRFYFKKNYNEKYGRANDESVIKGVDWINSIRNAAGGWDKETPRALITLSLVNNSFLTGSHETDLMQKYFQVYLGVNLLRDKPVSLNRLAMFVNALIATCQDPRDFQGWDLTELLRSTLLKLHRASRQPVINPIVYLSLCLADRNLTSYEVHHLMTYLVESRNDEATRDRTCLALEAFACHMQKERSSGTQFHSLQKMAWNATSKILQRMKEDGSFGSVYSTAIATKALMSVNETVEWNAEPTFRFLKSHQMRNGSFGDLLATYHVLSALKGRSLIHLRNTECNAPRIDRELTPLEILQYPGPKSYIRYSLHLGSPLATGHTVQVLVPTGITFFDVMKVAAYENDYFKFSYEEINGKINVYSISGIPNDAEEGLAWRLYVRNPSDHGNVPNIQQLRTEDVRDFLPTPDQHVIFWYHPLAL